MSFTWSCTWKGKDNPLEPCGTCEVRGNGKVFPLPTDLRLGYQRLKCPKCGSDGTQDHNLASAIKGWNAQQNKLRDGNRVFE